MERGTSRAVEKVGVTRVKVGVEASNVGDKEEMMTPQKNNSAMGKRRAQHVADGILRSVTSTIPSESWSNDVDQEGDIDSSADSQHKRYQERIRRDKDLLQSKDSRG